MSALALIEQARADGLQIWAAGDRLKLKGQPDVIERWKPRLASHKASIMAVLAPIDQELDRLIQRAAAYWGYSPDDFVLIYDLARKDPDGLRLALQTDVAFGRNAA